MSPAAALLDDDHPDELLRRCPLRTDDEEGKSLECNATDVRDDDVSAAVAVTS